MIKYSIMPLNRLSIQEICDDVERQYKTGVSTCVLFNMPINPTGDPVQDRAESHCVKYRKIKSELDKRNLKSGVLIQSTIGHGEFFYSMNPGHPFSKYVNLNDGAETPIPCLLDEDFRKYLYDSVVKICKCGPSEIMIDDDFRLISGRDGCGCGCEKHIKMFNDYAKTSLTRKEIYDIISGDSELSKTYSDIMLKVQKDSLISTAKIIRDAIDSVDKNIQGSISTGGDAIKEIARVMAGENKPSIVRIGNGSYGPKIINTFTFAFFRGATQYQDIKDDVDYVLAETDTCPQTVFSKRPSQLNAHFICSILEGLDGAKHWITRFQEYDPISLNDYRNELAKYSGMHETLYNTIKGIKWSGFKIPIYKHRYEGFKVTRAYTHNRFGYMVFERLGLPMFFSHDNTGITCFNMLSDLAFDDDELLEQLKGNCIMTADSAERIIERGFKDYLGFELKEWDGEMVNGEKVEYNDSILQLPVAKRKFVINDNNVKVKSSLVFRNWNDDAKIVAPASVEYKNKLGGTITAFCGEVTSSEAYTVGFGFCNYSRKLQFIDILKKSGELPVYCDNLDEVYLKVGTLKDGRIFAGGVNIGLSEIESYNLAYPTKPTKVNRIMPNGNIESIPFEYKNGIIVTNVTVKTLEPMLLIIE